MKHSELPIRIVVRTATPWERMSRADFYAQTHDLLDPFSLAETKRRSNVIVWEEATSRDFCAERAAIRDACQRYLTVMVPADHISIGLDNVSWLNGADDCILLPIDDDDTFEPAIIERMRETFADSSILLAVWKRRTNVVGTVRVEPANYLDTCNHAVRLSYLQRWSPARRRQMLGQHWIMHQEVMSTIPPAPVRPGIDGMIQSFLSLPTKQFTNAPFATVLNECLSTYYLHSASISFLAGGKMAAHVDTVAYLRGLPRHPLL